MYPKLKVLFPILIGAVIFQQTVLATGGSVDYVGVTYIREGSIVSNETVSSGGTITIDEGTEFAILVWRSEGVSPWTWTCNGPNGYSETNGPGSGSYSTFDNLTDEGQWECRVDDSSWYYINIQSSPILQPTIAYNPSSLYCFCDEGNDADSQTFSVWNSGDGVLNYSISDNASWLACSVTNGTSSGEQDTITVTYSTSDLQTDIYSSYITISDPAASNNPKNIPVNLTVGVIQPSIEISCDILEIGETETDITFQVWNSGTGTLNYNLNSISYPNWVTSIYPVSGSSTGNNDKTTHTVTINRQASDFDFGLPNSTILLVSSDSADNNPTEIMMNVSQSVAIYDTGFRPNINGFHFDNWGTLFGNDTLNLYGRCVGMSYASLYYWCLGFPTETPEQWGSGMRPPWNNKQKLYIETLQVTRFGETAFLNILSKVNEMSSPTSEYIEQEFDKIKHVISKGRPCPILVAGMTAGHAILVWKIAENNTKKRLWVYDNVYHDHDDNKYSIYIDISNNTWTMQPYNGYNRFARLAPFNYEDLPLAFILHSPATLEVYDPSGRCYVTSNQATPGIITVKEDFDLDGHSEEVIAFANPTEGDYSVVLTPMQGVDPNERLTLECHNDSKTTVLLDNVKVSDIPNNAIDIRVDNAIIDLKSFANFSLHWLYCNNPTDVNCDYYNFPLLPDCESVRIMGLTHTYDLNADCYVNIQDLLLFSETWLANYKSSFPPEKFVYIPEGVFLMGDHFSEGNYSELPVHSISVDSFYMGSFEISNQEYCNFLNALMATQKIRVWEGTVYAKSDSSKQYPYFDTSNASNSSHISYSTEFSVGSKNGRNMENDPVVRVSWYGAVVYCNWLNSTYGYEICYDENTWTCDYTKKGFRLPTEAEWEYAARGGEHDNYSRFCFGNTISHNFANYYSDSMFGYDISPTREWHPQYNDGIKPYTAPVGSFVPNEYGLFDIAGNVSEWCNDWYDSTYYTNSPDDNPTGPQNGTDRVVRGGTAESYAWGCRTANRSYFWPDYRHWNYGFRVVLDYK